MLARNFHETDYDVTDIPDAQHEQELIFTPPSIPPSPYGLMRQMLQRIKAAYQADDLRQVDELYEQAHGLGILGKALQGELEKKQLLQERPGQVVIQAIITNGNRIYICVGCPIPA